MAIKKLEIYECRENTVILRLKVHRQGVTQKFWEGEILKELGKM